MKKLNILANSMYLITTVLLLSTGSWQAATVLFGVFFLFSLLPQVTGVLKVVVSNPLIGKSKKSMGNATFTTWKGINVLKEKATSVANPNSDSQQMRRNAMSEIVTIFRNIPAAVRAGFKKLAIKKSEFNAFSSYNLKNGFDYSAAPAATLVPADVLVSKGTITPTATTGHNFDVSSDVISLTWDHATLYPGQSLTDKAAIVAYNETQDEWASSVGTEDRSNDSIGMTMPTGWVATNSVTAYLFFYNETSGESSDSVNVTATISA